MTNGVMIGTEVGVAAKARPSGWIMNFFDGEGLLAVWEIFEIRRQFGKKK